MQPEGHPYGKRRKSECEGGDPKRRDQTYSSKTQRLQVFAAQQTEAEDSRNSDPIEDALQRIGSPDDSEDEAVASDNFQEIAGSRRDAGHDPE